MTARIENTIQLQKKKCRICNENKPATLDYFYKSNINSYGKIFLKGHCKKCNKQVSQLKSPESNRRCALKYYHLNTDKVNRLRMMKVIKDRHCINMVL